MTDISKFKDIFISEAEDLFDSLTKFFLILEKNPEDHNALDGVMRSFHTLKSSAAAMGHQGFSRLAHAMEGVFDSARNRKLRLTPHLIDQALKVVDALRQSLLSIKDSNQELKVDALIDQVAAISEHTVISELPAEPRAEKTDIRQYVEKISHIKVPVERLDHLLDAVEELLVDKLKLEQLAKDNVGDFTRLQEITNHLNYLISDFQYQVMQARLIPVEQAFSRFPRMVRDLAKEQKKSVDLEMSGGDMELDRVIVDALAEPLIHLVRNAIDHGIEKSGVVKLKALRERNNALIIIENGGRKIDWIKVLSRAEEKRLLPLSETAKLRTQLEKAQDSFSPPPKDIQDMLFRGVSTKETVTEVSGRGVGLQVVKDFVDRIGGRVTVESPLDGKAGTRFTLELPLTLAIIKALLVDVRESIFAIPFSHIEKIVKIAPDHIKSVADQDVAIVDGVDVPLVRLEQLFGASPSISDKLLTAVIVKRGNEAAGFVVSKLLNQQEIIIKPLSPILRNLKGFSGSAILGDGRTILILDTAGILEDATKLVQTAYEYTSQ
jgi:two-component system chemotaxis sensor kinase CheA